jgi:hypothetical protein
MKRLSEGKDKVKSMRERPKTDSPPINSTAKKFVRLRPLFPQNKKALALPSGLFSRQGPGRIFQNATLKNLHLFPLAFRNSAGAKVSPIRPDLKRGLRQSACDFYCTCRTAIQPISENPIQFHFTNALGG